MQNYTFSANPLLLGFDRLDRMLERSSKSGNEGYPPYNIEQTSQNAFQITIAVAGFAESDLSITLEERKLVIYGKNSSDESSRAYIHRGIATRQFQKHFILAEGVEVADAKLSNGLLKINLERKTPEPMVRKIRIG